MAISETSKIRDEVLKFIDISMTGVDLGFGGDAILPNSINVDQPKKYTSVGVSHQHVFCDARKLTIFGSSQLDYVYSSHLLEDFLETKVILKEWTRVLKKEGLLILYLPNEIRYREECKKKGERSNEHHQILDMSSEYIIKILKELNKTEIVYNIEHGYSFLIIARRI